MPGLSLGYGHLPQPPIVLQNEPIALTARTFVISGITDERARPTPVASLIPDGLTDAAITDLQGGTLPALQSFIRHNVEGGNRLRNIVIGLKQLKITETLLPDKRIEGKISLSLSFGRVHPDDTVHLIDYTGGMHYIRTGSSRQAIEPCLRKSLMSALNYFNTWMNRQADNNIKLATAVKLRFVDYNAADADTIYYSPKRPLNWDDFRDKVRSYKYAASVFPGLGFDEHQVIEDATIYLTIALKVYLPKSGCWVKYDSQDDYTLNHEQRHFDIVKIIAERYKEKMLHASLPVDNCDGEVYSEYFEALHQMNVMQDSYDDETRHGINSAAQERWNQKITDELKHYGVIKS